MSRNEQKWPDTLWIVRHGQSAGNVARDAAELSRQMQIDLATRDVDTPLSSLGIQQAKALGRWLTTLSASKQPTVMLCSPFFRAVSTVKQVLQEANLDMDSVTTRIDERLREKEFGILDGLTKLGMREKYPQLAEQRTQVGKFYFRPPGGESWCDVLLRLRSVIDTLTRDYRRERVMIVAHQVIVNCFRYLLERLDETQILDIDRQSDIPNCAITSYEFDPAKGRSGKMVLKLVNFVAPLEESGTPVTAEPDTPDTKNVGA